MSVDAKINQAARLLAASQRLVVLTGAGVSKESGVPTFRDALEGLWSRFDPQELATAQAFRRNPKLVWNWYEYRRALVREAAPNPGHEALAALESLLPGVVVVTQNVDDLHQRAGSTDVIALHGAIMRSKCFNSCRGEPTIIAVEALPPGDEADGPPACPYCGGWVRPDVVWFGESLPKQALERAFALSEAADVMLVVGTSGVVQPAASLPFAAARCGARIIEANPSRSEITTLADVWLDAPSGEVLPRVVKALRGMQAEGLGDAI
ncbi:MAG: NAD-dependent deacylase [Anaerolineae bacterium]|nr:NAD-dependent deacylase [Anaerolineae bacterium]